MPPVKGRYIFEEPSNERWRIGHQLESLWEAFLPIKLTYNHRQEGQGRFAELLQRMARGIKTEEDLSLLRSRVFPENDPSIPADTHYVFPTKKLVKKYNEQKLNQLDGELEILRATNILSTRRQFEPPVDESDGKVRNTPLTNVLFLKRGARMVLIHNIDVC